MQFRKILVRVALVLCACVGTAPVAPAHAASHAPLGYQLMCLKTPAECRGGGSSTVAAAPATMSLLKRTNTAINAAIRPRQDGAVDVWDADASAGDCEDYALAKRKALIRAGLPPSSLRLAYVKTRSGEGHAILVVETSGGAFVLDNLSLTVKPLSQTGYRIISMSGANPLRWS